MNEKSHFLWVFMDQEKADLNEILPNEFCSKLKFLEFRVEKNNLPK